MFRHLSPSLASKRYVLAVDLGSGALASEPQNPCPTLRADRMAGRMARDPIYGGRRFSADTIETCVRWYVTYRLSYRDLSARMAEQGIVVAHTTIMRWVLRYIPEYEKRWARFARSLGSSWRMDETAVSVRGGRHYLYRAVDRCGKSVASLLCNDRSMEAAQAFFRAARTASLVLNSASVTPRVKAGPASRSSGVLIADLHPMRRATRDRRGADASARRRPGDPCRRVDRRSEHPR